MERTAVTGIMFLIALTAFASSGECSNVQAERWDGRSLKALTGAPVHGLALSLSAPKSTVHIGKPLDVVLEIRNVSGRGMRIGFGSRFGAYRIRIVNTATGETIKRRLSPRSGLDSIGGPSRGEAFEQGTSRFETLHLADMYEIDRPGAYRISVLNVRVAVPPDAVEIKDSNTVTVTVLP